MPGRTKSQTEPKAILRKVQKLLRDGRLRHILPAEVASTLGISHLDAALALRVLVEMGNVIKRPDGRYHFKDRNADSNSGL
jgi:hypothetical protein